MFRASIYLTRRTLCLAALLLLPAATGGCALWNKDVWNPNHYRDPRAVDIDRRLDNAEPLVKSPF
jgi:hypothetical protein